MFSIIISEKGGAERRETFDKNEINVGRVQGNDLMLPKGNVSKHHARLLFRDGRFIVTDLKSTNGTYVNGRKIAQATIVREGDKIYIGDFVLRLEAAGGAGAVDAPPPNEEESIRTLAREQQQMAQQQAPRPPPNPPAVTLKAPTHPPNQPLPRPVPTGNPSGPRPQDPIAIAPPLNDFRLDDGDSEPQREAPPPIQPPKRAPSVVPPAVPEPPAPAPPPPQAPPPIAAPMPPARNTQAPGRGAQTMPLQQMTPGPLPRTTGRDLPPVPGTPAAAAAAAAAAQAAPPPPPAPAPAPPPVQAPPPADRRELVSRPPASIPPPARPTKEQAGRRLAMQMLLDRVADSIDLSPLRSSPVVSDSLSQQLERAARDQANAMRDEGEAPEGIDLDGLVRDAHRELVHLGVVGPLLEDEEVTEIHCARFDQIIVVRGNTAQISESGFSSDEALFRVIARLAHQSGDPWKQGETILERRHQRGSFVAIVPPTAAQCVLTVRKRRRIDVSLEDFARQGTLSRPMATFLEACVTGRANVLVAGPGAIELVAGLAAACAPGDRLAVVHDAEEVNVGHAHVVSVAMVDTRARGEEALRAAAKLRTDRLVVTRLGGALVGALVEAVAEGSSGVLAACGAPGLRQAAARLSTQLVLSKSGIGIDAAHDAIAESFDVAVECGRGPDGRDRVLRVAETSGTDPKGVVLKDVFTFSPDGDGAFVATGVVPKIVAELAGRGVRVDRSIFQRR